MAEFLNQTIESEMHPMNQMGKPILMKARTEGYEHCKEMGLSSARAMECSNGVAEQLQRDQPYEAMSVGMKFLDLTGVYRLFAVLLTVSMQEEKSEAALARPKPNHAKQQK